MLITTIALLGVFSGSLVQTTAGFGFALIAAPLLLLTFQPAEMIAIIMFTSMLQVSRVLWGERRQYEAKRNVVIAILIAMVPGLVIGTFILGMVSKQLLSLAIGVLVLIAALLQVVKVKQLSSGLKAGPEAVAVGLVTGILSTATAIGGPPFVLWMRRHRVSIHEFRDTFATIALVGNIITIPLLEARGFHVLNPSVLKFFVLSVPVVLLGHWLGQRLLTKISERQFRQMSYILVSISALVAILTGLF